MISLANLRDPATLQRSPMLTKLVYGPTRNGSRPANKNLNNYNEWQHNVFQTNSDELQKGSDPCKPGVNQPTALGWQLRNVVECFLKSWTQESKSEHNLRCLSWINANSPGAWLTYKTVRYAQILCKASYMHQINVRMWCSMFSFKQSLSSILKN